MKDNFTLLLIISLFYVSCTKSNDLVVLDFEKAIEQKKKISIENYVTNSKFIALQTDLMCPVSGIEKIVTTETNFFILDSENILYMFKRNGDFVRSIGTKGRGPKEYTNLSDFSVDAIKQIMYLNVTKSIQVFDFDGKYLREIDNYGSSQFIVNSDKIIAAMPDAPAKTSSKDAIVVLDELGNIEKKITTSHVRESGFKFEFSLLYESNDHIFYKEKLGDTLFSIDKFLNRTPSKVFNLGKYKIPKNSYDYQFIESSDKYYRFVDVYDPLPFTIFKIQNGIIGAIHYIFWDKKTDLLEMIEKNEEYGLFLDNEYSIPIIPISVYKNHLIGYIYSFNFLKTKDKQNIQGNNRIINNNITINSNPILIDIQLKK